MSASLVGSEMCIRDRARGARSLSAARSAGAASGPRLRSASFASAARPTAAATGLWGRWPQARG
eukprot:2049895-Alexandrium_andersonii.AAC.1